MNTNTLISSFVLVALLARSTEPRGRATPHYALPASAYSHSYQSAQSRPLDLAEAMLLRIKALNNNQRGFLDKHAAMSASLNALEIALAAAPHNLSGRDQVDEALSDALDAAAELEPNDSKARNNASVVTIRRALDGLRGEITKLWPSSDQPQRKPVESQPTSAPAESRPESGPAADLAQAVASRDWVRANDLATRLSKQPKPTPQMKELIKSAQSGFVNYCVLIRKISTGVTKAIATVAMREMGRLQGMSVHGAVAWISTEMKAPVFAEMAMALPRNDEFIAAWNSTMPASTPLNQDSLKALWDTRLRYRDSTPDPSSCGLFDGSFIFGHDLSVECPGCANHPAAADTWWHRSTMPSDIRKSFIISVYVLAGNELNQPESVPTSPCVACGGRGVTRVIGTNGTVADVECEVCHGLRKERRFKYR